MKYQIFIANKNKKTVLKLPILPVELPEKTWTAESTDFTSASGKTYNIIGSKSLMETELDALVPQLSKGLKFTASKLTGLKLNKLIQYAMDHKEPIWLMIVNGNGIYYINSRVSIVSYSMRIDKKNDYNFTISMKGWRKY